MNNEIQRIAMLKWIDTLLSRQKSKGMQVEGNIKNLVNIACINGNVQVGANDDYEIVDALNRVVDRLRFAAETPKSTYDFFAEVIEPIFKDLLSVHLDYMQMFEETLTFVSSHSASNALTYLRTKRIVNEPMRIKIYTLVKSLHKKKLTSDCENFVYSVLSYFPGGQLGRASLSTTILARLNQWEEELGSSKKSKHMRRVDAQKELESYIKAIMQNQRTRWIEVCETYALVQINRASLQNQKL